MTRRTDELVSEFQRKLQAAFQGDLTVADALSEAAVEIDALLAQG